jgi:alkylated DNA repair dioxygenase AlkB
VAKQEYEDLLKQLHEKEQYSYSVVKDHVELKHVFELEERAKHEENEQIRQDNFDLRSEIRRLANFTNSVVAEAKAQYEMNTESQSEEFRNQIRDHNKTMSMIRDQYHKLGAVYKQKVQALKEQHASEKQKLEQKSAKRSLDLEGF